MQRYEDALKSYNQVIQIESKTEFDLCMQAFALCKLERYDEAFAYCEKSLKKDSNYSFAFYCKACCYLRQNNMDLALETFRQAIQLSPCQIKFYVRSERIFDPIRENLLFKQIVET